MGGCACVHKERGLPLWLEQKVQKVFKEMDVDGSKSIDKGETIKFWKSNFAKVNTEAMYKAVDIDKNGEISEDEWLAFWIIVKKCGHTEEEIDEELENLMKGGAWVYFDKVPTDADKLKKMIDKERKSTLF